MYTVRDLYEKFGEDLGLKLLAGKEGINKRITNPEAQRPGLSLAGYLRGKTTNRILIFGRIEINYLRDLKKDVRLERLRSLVERGTPAIMIARGYRPLRELLQISEEQNIPLFQAKMTTMNLLSKLILLLGEEFSPSISCHGTLVEAFGIGVLIKGDSSVGKSEAALGLIERGHRLISDDIVLVKKKGGSYLEGSGPELTRHMMEIRGIGIINVAHLYGAVCVSEKKKVDIIVKLEEWNDRHFYDRIGLEEKYFDILGINVPYYVLPVKPGRDVILLLETIVLNHRLKGMGYHSAKEFNTKLLEEIGSKRDNRRKVKQLEISQ